MIGRALSRSLRWAVHRVGETNLLFLTVLLLGVGSTALGVADRVRGVDPLLALTLAALGLFAGWLISLTPLSPGWATSMIGVLGLGVILLRVGRLGGELLALSRAWHQLVGESLWWMLGGAVPAWRPVWGALAGLGEGTGTLLARVTAWATALVAGDPGFDPVAVSLIWGLGLWAVGGWAGWLTRRRAWTLGALTPCGILLMLAFSNVWGSHIYLLGLLLAGFLLLGLVSYDQRVRRWHATNVDYPELRPQTIAVTGLTALALVALAQALPSLSLDRILDLAPVIRTERPDGAKDVAASFGMEDRRRTTFQEAQVTGLPRQHLLDAGPELSEQVVMVISTEDRPPGKPEGQGWEPPRYYWRSHTYDRYLGSGWAAGGTEVVVYEAGAPAITGTLSAPGALMTQRVVRQEVRWSGGRRDLAHVAGTLMVADHAYAVAWRSPEDPFAVTIQAKGYRADSYVAMADEKGLREDRGGYPAWVRDRYLALPEGIPPRVLALARDLTATAATPYDRALAIEAYLRRFPYTLDVSTPPQGRDVVDYFLFDLKKGYCDYYASAMVVLSRAAGLPARLAVGYTSGVYEASEARYVVTEADAHAWPEVYFPTFGWVRFEPTASLERLEHVADAETTLTAPEVALEPATAGWWRHLRRTWWQVALGSVALFGLAGVAWHGLDRWRLAHREPERALASLYRRLRTSGQGLGVPVAAGDTPREFGAAFAAWLEGRRDGRSQRWLPGREMEGGGRLVELLAAGAEEVSWLTATYALASYSPRLPGAADRAQALRVWRRLRWRLRLAWVLGRLGLAVMDRAD